VWVLMGQLTRGQNWCSPGTKYKRSKIVFTVTSFALSLGHCGPRLLGFAMLSLTGSPGSVNPGTVTIPNIGLHKTRVSKTKQHNRSPFSRAHDLPPNAAEKCDGCGSLVSICPNSPKNLTSLHVGPASTTQN